MPLDDRIQRLADTIIHEVRGPIEDALHHLLADVMAVASEDRDLAVQSALAAAAAEHQAALAAVEERAGLDRVDEEALRNQLEQDREARLAALRHQLEQDREARLAELRNQLEQERDASLADLRNQLEQDREAGFAALRDTLERGHADELAGVRDALGREHREQIVALRGELAREHDASLDAIREDLAREHETALGTVRDELARERDAAIEAVRAEVAHLASEAAGTAALAAAVTDADRGKQEAEVRAAALEQELDRSRHDADQARQAAEEARADADRARADVSLAQQAARDEERARQDAEDRRLAAEEGVTLAHASERQQELACSDRTLDAFRRMDAARSLTEILDILADQAELEIGRVAILMATASRLRGLTWRGLPGADAAAFDSPVVPGTVFALAISTGLPASTSDAPIGADGEPLAALLSAPPDRVGLAIPIAVGGQVVAILYADDAGRQAPVVPSAWPEIAELLARHAGRCLEVVTAAHAAALAGRVIDEPASDGSRLPDMATIADERREEESARRYARLLISEIKLYNEATVEQGRIERNLLARLGPEIERARRLFEEKIPAAVRQRADCFDEEVVRTLAGGDAEMLGQT